MSDKQKIYLVSSELGREAFFDYDTAFNRFNDLLDKENGERLYRYILEQTIIQYVLRPTNPSYKFDHDVDEPLVYDISLRSIWSRLPSDLREFLFNIAVKRISCCINKLKPTPVLDTTHYAIDRRNIDYAFHTIPVEPSPVDK